MDTQLLPVHGYQNNYWGRDIGRQQSMLFILVHPQHSKLVMPLQVLKCETFVTFATFVSRQHFQCQIADYAAVYHAVPAALLTHLPGQNCSRQI